MIVVSDTSPLIALDGIGQLAVLPDMYGRVLVPSAVWQELHGSGLRDRSRTLAEATWLDRAAVRDERLVAALLDSLDVGEAEAIALAIEHHADVLLIDERIGRRTAQRLGLRVVGVVAVLVEAKHRGLVPAIAPLLDGLRDVVGFRLARSLVARVLRDEGEE